MATVKLLLQLFYGIREFNENRIFYMAGAGQELTHRAEKTYWIALSSYVVAPEQPDQTIMLKIVRWRIFNVDNLTDIRLLNGRKLTLKKGIMSLERNVEEFDYTIRIINGDIQYGSRYNSKSAEVSSWQDVAGLTSGDKVLIWRYAEARDMIARFPVLDKFVSRLGRTVVPLKFDMSDDSSTMKFDPQNVDWQHDETDAPCKQWWVAYPRHVVNMKIEPAIMRKEWCLFNVNHINDVTLVGHHLVWHGDRLELRANV